MPTNKLKKSLLASSIAMLMAANTQAQNQAGVTEEEVVVTGIRASLKRSMDLKRNSSGVVDAISAEDIGKFPDTNLAESLQRITGVSIDRVDGEGSKITVRGIDPQFNLVTLNGRSIARTTGDRSFDFANLASEMVSAVEVAKTSDAKLFSGGMGSTVTLRTHRPLESPGLKLIGSLKAVDDQSTEEGSATPELAALYSQTFAEDTLGVSIGISYQERENGKAEARVGTGWRSFDGSVNQDWGAGTAEWGGVPDNGQVNPPIAGELYSVPQTTIYRFTEQQRKRLNGQLVLQWQPVESFKATLDYNRFEREVDTQHNDVSAWFTFAPSQNVWTSGDVSSPLIYSETYFGDSDEDGFAEPSPQDLSMGSRDSSEKFETDAFGLNLDWQVTEKLALAFDAAYSKAERNPNSPWGSSNSLSTAAFIRTSASTDFTEDLPALIAGGGNDVQPSDMRVTGSVFGNSRDESEIEQYQLDGKFNVAEGHSIDFGVEFTEVSNHHQAVNVQRNDWGGVGVAGDLDSSMFPRRSVLDRFDSDHGDFSEPLNITYRAEEDSDGNVIISGDGDPVTSNYTLQDGTVLNPVNIQDVYFAIDFEALRSRAEALYTPDSFGSDDIVGDCGTQFCPSTDYGRDQDRQTTEETNSIYLQYNFIGQDLNIPLDVHFGLRYEETDVHSMAASLQYGGATWIADTEITLAPARDGSGNQIRPFLEREGNYDHLLPNLNINFNITDDMTLRLAASKTIGRANFNDLKAGTVVSPLANRSNAGGSTGNAGLEPLESTNYDVSYEWYYDESSYFSIGYFKKDVKNFISNTKLFLTSEDIWGEGVRVYNPAAGPLVDEAVAAVGADAGAIRNYIFTNYANLAYVSPRLDDEGDLVGDIEGTSADELMEFQIDSPSNGETENGVDGFEIAVQHMFGESGFGAIANMTIVDSDLSYDVSLDEDQEALIGVSDTANLVFFYDKGGLNARLAWNWRDKFLNSRGQDTGANPKFTEEYQQFDLNVSYEFFEGFEGFVEGINITDEKTREHGRDSRQILNLTETGPRWQVGARYAF